MFIMSKLNNINVAKNVAQRNSQDLTEQWKKGELKDGEYYIKSNKGDIYIDVYDNSSFMFTNYRSIEEVLGEVPDYTIWRNYVTGFCDEHEYNLKLLEENQRLRKWVEEFNALNVAQENQKLKELLETCQTYLDVHSTEDGDITINDITTTAFIGIIEEALNDKNIHR